MINHIENITPSKEFWLKGVRILGLKMKVNWANCPCIVLVVGYLTQRA